MPNISIDRRYYFQDSVPRAWPPGAEVFTGENNRKANYALDLNIDGQTMTFIPSSVIEKGVYSPWSDIRVANKSYYLPWFLDPNNQQQLAEVGKKVDLSKSDVASYLKDEMGASTDGVLIPKGSLPFDSQVVSAPGKVQGMGNINGQPVYINEDYTKSGRTFFTDAAGQTREYIPGDDGGFFGGFLGDLAGGVSDIWQSLGPIGQVAALYYGGSALGEALGAAAPAAEAGALTGADAAMADLAASAPAFSGAAPTAFAGALPEGFSTALPAAGAGVQVASLAPEAGLSSLTPAVEGMGGAQGLQLPQAANLAEMGGAQGLGGGTTLANLAEMGGAQGLTAAAAGGALGDMLGQSGVGGALTPAAAGLGAGLGLSDAAVGAGSTLAGTAAGTTLANAATGGGSTLADILPYTAGAGVLGGYLQSNAAKEAAQIQADAANKALAQQQANFELINAQQAPYRGLGYQGINTIRSMLPGSNVIYDEQGKAIGTGTGSDYLTHQFNAADLAAGLAPNYDFMLKQGQMANQRAANVGGGALSGNTLQGLQKYTQDYAGNAYQNAFTNYQNQRSNIYNTLANIAGIGQTGQTATNTAATNATNAASQLGVGSAAAQAAGGVGSANAYTNAINNATNNYTLASLLNQRGNVAMPVQG